MSLGRWLAFRAHFQTPLRGIAHHNRPIGEFKRDIGAGARGERWKRGAVGENEGVGEGV